MGIGIFLIGAFLVIRPGATSNQALDISHSQSSRTGRELGSRWGWLKYSLPMLAFWLIYLVGFWPGLMSPDSFVSWRQALTGQYENWHPQVYAMYIRMVTRIWESPAAIVFAGIILAALFFSIGVLRLEKHGVSRNLCWGTAFLLAVFPTIGIMNVILWKDVLYSLLLLALTILVFEIVTTSGRWISSWANMLLLVVTGLLLALLRHNGLPVILLIFFCLAVIYRSRWRQLLLGGLTIPFLWYLITGPLYNGIGVVKNDAVLKSGLAVHQIAAHLADQTPLTESELEILNHVRPVEDDWTYNCFSVNNNLFHPNFNAAYVKDHQLDLIKIAIQLTLRRPLVTLKHYLCVGSLAYRVTTDPKGYLYTGPLEYDSNMKLTMPENSLGIELALPIPALSGFLGSLWQVMKEQGYSWLFWRPALFFYLFLFGLLIHTLRTRNRYWLVLGLPTVFHMLTSFILIQAQDARYYYGTILIGLMYIPFLFFGSTQPVTEAIAPNPIKADSAEK